MEEPIYRLEGVVQSKAEPEDFVGPLDLILYLLRKNKIAIEDISISVLLDQYLDYLRRRQEMDLTVTSDFVAMAAHLMYIKTRMLLSLQDEEAQSEMELLIRSLEERRCSAVYAGIRGVTEELHRREEVGLDLFIGLPEPLTPDHTYRYVHRKEELRDTMRAVAQRVGSGQLPPPAYLLEPIVSREPYPVARKLEELWRRLTRRREGTPFRQLFRGAGSRSEIVAVFLAVLELCRDRRVELIGDGPACTVACCGDAAAQE